MLAILLVATVTIPARAAAAADPAAIRPAQLSSMSALEYYRTKSKLHRLTDAEEWSSAVALCESLITAYPYDGAVAADCGLANHRVANFQSAAKWFALADELGLLSGVWANAANAASAYMRAGNHALALEWLERAVLLRRHQTPIGVLSQDLFEPLHDNPRFVALRRFVGIDGDAPAGGDDDVKALATQIHSVVPDYRAVSLPPGFDKAAAEMKGAGAQRDPFKLMLATLEALESLGKGHAVVADMYRASRGDGSPMLAVPLTYYTFPEGLFITAAEAPFEHLVGARVVKIGTADADLALGKMASLVPGDNRFTGLWLGPNYLRYTQLMNAAGLSKRSDQVELVLERRGKTENVVVSAAPWRPTRELFAPPGAPGEVPMYLRKPESCYWFTPLPHLQSVWLQYNCVSSRPDQPITQFVRELRREVRRSGAKNLIIDVRRNQGGNTYSYTPLLRAVIEHSVQPGKKVFLVTGRRTYSAAQNFATEVERLADAVIVGEPSGGRPGKQAGDAARYRLPKSGIEVGLPTTTWSLASAEDTRGWISPDIPVTLTAADFFANRDPVYRLLMALLMQDGGGPAMQEGQRESR